MPFFLLPPKLPSPMPSLHGSVSPCVLWHLPHCGRPPLQAVCLGPAVSPEAQDLDFVFPSVLCFPHAALTADPCLAQAMGIHFLGGQEWTRQPHRPTAQPCPLGGHGMGLPMPPEAF